MEWHDYLQRATDVAEPYLDRAIEAVNAAQRGLDRRRRKIKRRIGLYRLKQGLEVAGNVVLVLAALVSLVLAMRSYLSGDQDD